MFSAVQDELQHQVALGNVKLNFFTFKLTFINAAPGAVAPQSFQISNNINFLLMYINGTVFDPAGTNIPAPDLMINLSDNSTGWLFSDNPVHWMEIVGNAQNPGILPEPKLIPSNASINCAITNRSATTFDTIDLALIGAQVFTYNGFRIEDLPVMG